MEIGTLFRQGDTTLRYVGPPKGLAPSPRVVLAIGEDSGHAHVMRNVSDVVVDAKRYIDVPQTTQLRIEPEGLEWRHQNMEIPPGHYELLGVMGDEASKWFGQREYSPEAIRNLND